MDKRDRVGGEGVTGERRTIEDDIRATVEGKPSNGEGRALEQQDRAYEQDEPPRRRDGWGHELIRRDRDSVDERFGKPPTQPGPAFNTQAPAPTQVGTIAAQTSTALDAATAYVVDQIAELIKELEDLKAYVITDGARVKQEVSGHVDVASEAVLSVSDIRKRMDEMKRRRTIQMQITTRG